MKYTLLKYMKLTLIEDYFIIIIIIIITVQEYKLILAKYN